MKSKTNTSIQLNKFFKNLKINESGIYASESKSFVSYPKRVIKTAWRLKKIAFGLITGMM